MWLMRRAAVVCAALAGLPVILFVVGAAIGEMAGCIQNGAEATVSCTLSGKLMLWSVPAAVLAVPALLVLLGWIVSEIVNAWRT